MLSSTSHSSRAHWRAWSHHAPLLRHGPQAWMTLAFTPLKITVDGIAFLLSPCLRVSVVDVAHSTLAGNGGRNQRKTSRGAGGHSRISLCSELHGNT